MSDIFKPQHDLDAQKQGRAWITDKGRESLSRFKSIPASGTVVRGRDAIVGGGHPANNPSAAEPTPRAELAYQIAKQLEDEGLDLSDPATITEGVRRLNQIGR